MLHLPQRSCRPVWQRWLQLRGQRQDHKPHVPQTLKGFPEIESETQIQHIAARPASRSQTARPADPEGLSGDRVGDPVQHIAEHEDHERDFEYSLKHRLPSVWRSRVQCPSIIVSRRVRAKLAHREVNCARHDSTTRSTGFLPGADGAPDAFWSAVAKCNSTPPGS
jgi:hypothetical protein